MPEQDHPQNDVGARNGHGCLTIAVVCLCACVLVVSSVFCGFSSYLVAALFGSKSIASSITGAVAAIVMICVNFPGGVAVWFCLCPGEGQVRDGIRASLGIGLAALTIFVHGASVFFWPSLLRFQPPICSGDLNRQSRRRSVLLFSLSSAQCQAPPYANRTTKILNKSLAYTKVSDEIG